MLHVDIASFLDRFLGRRTIVEVVDGVHSAKCGVSVVFVVFERVVAIVEVVIVGGDHVGVY